MYLKFVQNLLELFHNFQKKKKSKKVLKKVLIISSHTVSFVLCSFDSDMKVRIVIVFVNSSQLLKQMFCICLK